MIKLILVLYASMPFVICHQDSDDSLKAKADVIKARTNASIKELEEKIKNQNRFVEGAKRGIVAGRFQHLAISRDGQTFETKEQKETAIKKAEQDLSEMTDQLAKLQNGNSFDLGTLEFPLKLGDFGQLPQAGGSILKVVDDKSLLITIHSSKQQSAASDQVVVMVKGISTKGMAAGSDVNLDDVFEVTKTVQYSTTPAGESTVFLLMRLDKSRLESFLKK